MKSNPATGFPGLTHGEAVEQAQLTIGQAKKNIYGVPADVLAALLGRRP
jgi:hypothetical protein